MNISLSDESYSNDSNDQNGKKVACIAFLATIQGSSGFRSAEIDGNSYEEDLVEGSVKGYSHIVSYDILVRNCIDARKKCKELQKQLATTEAQNIFLQNLLDLTYKSEESLKVENNSLITKLFDTDKMCESL